MLGRALVAALVATGVRVRALARSTEAMEAVRAAGAQPVYGDLLGDAGAWASAAADAEAVYHLGLPRLNPPVRRTHARRRTREAQRAARALAGVLGTGGASVVVASSALVYGDRGAAGPASDDAPPVPLALAEAALAAERALAGPDLRAVRLPWVYGPGGLARDLIVGLRMGRYRVVGPGDNRWALLGVADAVAALRAAAGAPAGVYTAAEPDPPTQLEVVRALCAMPGLRQPDHVPRRMASVALGGAMAEALGAALDVRTGRLMGEGWAPGGDWRRDLPALTAVDLPVAGRPG